MAPYDLATFNPDVSVGYLAKRIFQLTVVGLEPAFAEAGVTYLQWSALVSIGYGRGGTCRELAHEIAHDKGATTRLLDLLEGRGFVTRERGEADRRVVNLALTDEGRTVALSCLKRVVDSWNGWLADWEPSDVARLIGYLQRLHGTLRDAVGAAPCA